MLAGGLGVPREISGYQLEPKLDGQRVLATAGSAGVLLTARTGADITATYPEFASLVGALGGREASGYKRLSIARWMVGEITLRANALQSAAVELFSRWRREATLPSD